MPPASVAKMVVRDPEQPRAKICFVAKVREPAISADEGFLREVVGACAVTAGEVTQKPAHRRLVTLHEFTERIAVVVNERACDELSVSCGHDCASGSYHR